MYLGSLDPCSAHVAVPKLKAEVKPAVSTSAVLFYSLRVSRHTISPI